MLETLRSKCVVLMGDFNYPKINWDSLESDSNFRRLLDTIMDNFWVQYVLSPTREGNILDFVFTSEEYMLQNLVICENIESSDHCMLLFDIVFNYMDSNDTVSKYNFFRGNYKEICKLLKDVIWFDAFNSCVSIDDMWNMFLQTLQDCIETYVPKYKPRDKFKYPVWMNRSARLARNKKFNLWARFNSSQSYNDKIECKLAHNEATKIYRLAQKEYEINLAKQLN